MKGKDPVEQSPIYNRKLLLDGKKRNAVLDLWEVRRYGADSYSDVDYVSIYGMRPAAWYAKGVRLLGRTAVECTRDPLGEMIGKDVAAVSARAPHTTGALVVDLFAGSGNTLYWLLRHLAAARGLGFESDAGVFRLTHQNLAALALPIDIRKTDLRMLVVTVSLLKISAFSVLTTATNFLLLFMSRIPIPAYLYLGITWYFSKTKR